MRFEKTAEIPPKYGLTIQFSGARLSAWDSACRLRALWASGIEGPAELFSGAVRDLCISTHIRDLDTDGKAKEERRNEDVYTFLRACLCFFREWVGPGPESGMQ